MHIYVKRILLLSNSVLLKLITYIYIYIYIFFFSFVYVSVLIFIFMFTYIAKTLLNITSRQKSLGNELFVIKKKTKMMNSFL